MGYFERPEIDSKLNSISKVSHCFSVIGPRGVGKSTTIKHWIRSQGYTNIKWISLLSRTNLIDKISPGGTKDNLSLEEALDLFSTKWSQFDVIVWEDVHQISSQHLTILVSYLKNSFNPPINIFISDENLMVLKAETPHLLFPPFTEEEIETYLKQYLGAHVNKPVAEIKKITGGMPHLINLWVNSEQSNSVLSEAIIHQFSEEDKLNLTQLYFLKSLPANSTTDRLYENLCKRFYVQKIDNEYFLQPYLEGEIELRFPRDLKKLAGKLAFEYLKTDSSNTPQEQLFLLAIRAELPEEVNSILLSLDLKKLEALRETDVKFIFNQCFKRIEEASWESMNPQASQLLRVTLKSGIQCGERKRILDKLNLYIDKYLNVNEWTQEHLWFCYDLIYWNNRSGRSKEVALLLNKVNNISTGELKYLSTIEMSYSLAETDMPRALQLLDRVTNNLKTDKKNNIKIIYAQAILFKATCYHNRADYSEALNLYTEGENIYTELKQYYFAMVCRMNRLFIVIEQLELELAKNLIKELFLTTKKYGYLYLLSGAHFAQSKIHLEELELSEALKNINQALELIPEGIHPDSKRNLIERKIDILLKLGHYNKAEKLFKEQLDTKSSPEIACEFLDLSFEDSQEMWLSSESNKDKLDYKRFLLAHGEILPEAETKIFQRTLRGRLALLENKISYILKKDYDREALLKAINEMDGILSQVQDEIFEKLFLEFYKIDLSSHIDSPSQIEKFKALKQTTELSSIDDMIKRPLFAILEAKIQSLPDFTLTDQWNSCRNMDKKRWLNWLQTKATKTQRNFLLTTINSKEELDRWDDNISEQYDLVLLEHLGRVYLNNKEVSEFHRKAVLRQLLAFILEVYPQSINKSQLAHIIWGESYSPELHDSRIYTSIQRLRQLLSTTAIESWEGGYKWCTSMTFAYIKAQQTKALGQSKIRTLILQTLQNYQKSGKVWISRSELVEATQSSESTVKRELSKLLNEGEINRQGAGPSVLYSLPTSVKISS